MRVLFNGLTPGNRFFPAVKSRLILTFAFVFLFLAAAALPLAAQDAGAEPEAQQQPVEVSFTNTSDHQVHVHLLSFDTIQETHVLEAGGDLKLDVEAGNRIRLEYATCPNRTELSPMGSVNELKRMIEIRNDGETVFIQERFEGQRVKSKGTPRIKHNVISEPELLRGNSTRRHQFDHPKKAESTPKGLKPIPDHLLRPRGPVESVPPTPFPDSGLDDSMSSKKSGTTSIQSDGIPRKEDPSQPEDKFEVDKSKGKKKFNLKNIFKKAFKKDPEEEKR